MQIVSITKEAIGEGKLIVYDDGKRKLCLYEDNLCIKNAYFLLMNLVYFVRSVWRNWDISFGDVWLEK